MDQHKLEAVLSEIELKLSSSPEHLEKVKQTLESMEQVSRPAASTLVATYYDTDDRKLHQGGFSLRVRDEDGRYVQTLKSHDREGPDVLTHDEWEDAITNLSPDFSAPQSGPRLTNLVLPGELRPLFKTSVRRTRFEIEPRPAIRIEVSLDEGEIRGDGDDASEAICEVELELKSGDPAALYDLGLRLVDAAPLRIETRSKAERGYRLISNGAPEPAVRARPVPLDGSMTVEATLQSIGRSCIAHLLCNGPAVLAGTGEGIHQMRVAARRLRAALSALKPMIPAAQYRWVLEELKWLSGTMGPARNWDVFAVSLLKPVTKALPVEPELERLANVAEQRRRAAYEQVEQAIRSQRYTVTMLQLAQWFEARRWRDQPASEQAALLFAPISEVAPGLIERSWRRTRKRSRHFKQLKQEQRHRLRIALKRLRYTIDFLRDLFDHGEVKALEKRMKPLQENLGHLNDVHTAHTLTDEVSRHVNEGGSEISRAGGIVLGWHDRGLIDREPKLRKDVKRLRRGKPFWRRGNAPLAAPLDAAPAVATDTANGEAATAS
jgi:inorganic triphosphatase YgiF